MPMSWACRGVVGVADMWVWVGGFCAVRDALRAFPQVKHMLIMTGRLRAQAPDLRKRP